eukprot:4985353-Karenia_brevis.AAC.1
MDQEEEWKQYMNTHYWVSNHGRVKRTFKNGRTSYIKGVLNRGGYVKMDISKKPVRVSPLLHTMVATCFIDNPDNKPQVDHINEIKTDNRVSNLRWVTNEENQRNISKLRTTNTSGCAGVKSRKYKGEHTSWRVCINVNNRRINIGDYKDYDEAVK